MNVKKKARRVMSGLLTAVTVLSTVLSPAVAYASDDAGSVKKIPYYEEIKDQLDEDEVVTAKDYEIKVGDNFDVKSDYTGLTIQDDSKVKVTFQEAKDTDGNDFSTDYANSYKAVYYVEPQTTDHPTYQINRKIVVKEADQQKDSQSESSSDQDAGSSDETETEDSEGVLSIAAFTSLVFGYKEIEEIAKEPGVFLTEHLIDELKKIQPLQKIYLNEIV